VPPLEQRIARARQQMRDLDVDILCLAEGPDLLYLTGYAAMPLERLTMLVLPRDADAILVVPRLEVPRVVEQPELFTIRPWDETEDPITLVANRIRAARTVAIGDTTWARFVLALQAQLPDARFITASRVTTPLRIVKDDAEISALQRAAHAVDEIAHAMRSRPFAGRSERDIQREIVDRILATGHERVNFAIVASGPNAASPHHESGDRVVQQGDVVLCDFGGTMAGYCSDITRMYVAGTPTPEVVDAYDALTIAQAAAVEAATIGTTCADVDGTARQLLGEADLAGWFIHRTGHGIGLEAHEDPYIVAGNTLRLAPGHAFSVEPGVYLPERFGLRLEDIVVATATGPHRLNEASRDLASVG
jgi:Xaa-Pro aminopeptidase